MVNTRSSGKVKKKISLERKVCDKKMRIKTVTSKRSYNSKKAFESVKKRRRRGYNFVKERLKDFEPLIAVDNRFLGKLAFSSSYSVINDIKQILSPVQLDMFRKSCFGYFLDLNGMRMQPKLFHSLLLREVHHSNKKELWFDVRGKKLRFGIFEFATVTGLRCMGDESRFSSVSVSNGLYDTYFKNEKINRVLIEKMFKSSSFGSDDEAVKFAKLYFTQCFLLSSNENTKVEERFIHLVDSDLCDEYLWGKYCFEKTVESMKHRLASQAKRSHDDSDFFYRLYGLPYAVQIWFYECISPVLDFLCNLENPDRIPRMLRWTPKDLSVVRNTDHTIFEDAYEKLELKNISASHEEISVLHLDGLSEQGMTTYDVARENLKEPNLGVDDVRINYDDNLGSSSGLVDKRVTVVADSIPVSMLFDFMKDIKDVIVKEIGGLKEFTEKRLADQDNILASVVQKIDSFERRAFQKIDTDKSAEVGVNFTLNDTFHCGSAMISEKEDADAENLDDDHIYDKADDANKGSEQKEDMVDDTDNEFDVSVFTSETETDAAVVFKSE
ncbi:uncharacterized protein LOC126654492 isoform X2 [Mercurialis annua]|uniref:uncharacterized protein LOC126654492 isoform X2 n=1 Tax=Mercurialis annua TaxID=3986 RepID=UPI00215F810A|nr:uncharacterized protein LOC126654492 isoform X2 [Mercurialis annua]